MDFKHFVQLVAIGLQARIPLHMIGFPGVGKTEFTKSLEGGFTSVGVKCKVITLVGSIREPQDFGGFPVSTPDGVRLLPMAWARDARRLAEDGYMVVIFLDELTTVPPTTQAAMLRLLTENVSGELPLPDYEPGKGGVVYLCASNAVEWAAGGQEIQPPMANRLWHGEFPMDHETWCEMMLSDFPAPTDLPVLPADYLRTHHHSQRAIIAGYIKATGHDAWLAPPDDIAQRSGPWASGRTWYLASRFLAAIEAVSPGNRALQGPALAGLVGDQALPFLEYRETLNLPDPEEILKDPRRFELPDRVDRAYAACYALVGAVLNNKTPQRWEAALIALGSACRKNADIPTAAARTLCAKANRPDGVTKLPAECKPFYELMQVAKLVPDWRPSMRITLGELFGGRARKTEGYVRGLQAARVRAAYQRAYFAPALFNLIPVETDLIASMAVDADWRLYYNPAWIKAHSVEENAAVLLHEVGHLVRDHADRKKAAAAGDERRWNTAGDCEINDDLHAEGLVLPGEPPLPGNFGLQTGQTAEIYYHQLPESPRAKDVTKSAEDAKQPPKDCGSGAHGERRSWELPSDDAASGGVGGVDRVKAEMIRREVAQRIMELARDRGDIPFGWRRWAHERLTPKIDYMATIRHAVRRALRDSTVGRYDRTYRRPHRRQACYGEFIMPSFYQPRPRPGFLIDTSGSMDDTQLGRAIAELGGLTRQLGYGADVIVSCCDAAVHSVKKVFTAAQVELFGGGGTDMAEGLRSFVEPTRSPIDVLIIVSDCLTPWPETVPPFPVITIRVGDGAPPPWGTRGTNKVITIQEPAAYREETLADRMRRWRRD